MDLDTLKQLYANNASNAQSMQKSFTDMLKERRGFVQGQEDQNFGAIRNSIQNGSNGVPINPVDAIGDFLNFSTANSNKTNELVQEGAAYGRQSTDALNSLTSLLNMASDNSFKERELGLKEKELGLQYGGANSESEVLKQGGAELLNQAKDPQARRALANTILQIGGVNSYKKTLPVDSLLTDKERESMASNVDLLAKIDQAIGLFSGGDQPLGTGPLAQFIPGIVAPEKTREMRRYADDLRAQYQKIISGATVSDAEAKRLEKFLPTSSKTESQNLGDLQKLKRDLEINMKLFEVGKREGLTPNQAYSKYGKQFFNEASGNNGKQKVGGYTIEKIE